MPVFQKRVPGSLADHEGWQRVDAAAVHAVPRARPTVVVAQVARVGTRNLLRGSTRCDDADERDAYGNELHSIHLQPLARGTPLSRQSKRILLIVLILRRALKTRKFDPQNRPNQPNLLQTFDRMARFTNLRAGRSPDP